MNVNEYPEGSAACAWCSVCVAPARSSIAHLPGCPATSIVWDPELWHPELWNEWLEGHELALSRKHWKRLNPSASFRLGAKMGNMARPGVEALRLARLHYQEDSTGLYTEGARSCAFCMVCWLGRVATCCPPVHRSGCPREPARIGSAAFDPDELFDERYPDWRRAHDLALDLDETPDEYAEPSDEASETFVAGWRTGKAARRGVLFLRAVRAGRSAENHDLAHEVECAFCECSGGRHFPDCPVLSRGAGAERIEIGAKAMAETWLRGDGRAVLAGLSTYPSIVAAAYALEIARHLRSWNGPTSSYFEEAIRRAAAS